MRLTDPLITVAALLFVAYVVRRFVRAWRRESARIDALIDDAIDGDD
jgi:hypothetical protein